MRVCVGLPTRKRFTSGARGGALLGWPQLDIGTGSGQPWIRLFCYQTGKGMEELCFLQLRIDNVRKMHYKTTLVRPLPFPLEIGVSCIAQKVRRKPRASISPDLQIVANRLSAVPRDCLRESGWSRSLFQVKIELAHAHLLLCLQPRLARQFRQWEEQLGLWLTGEVGATPHGAAHGGPGRLENAVDDILQQVCGLGSWLRDYCLTAYALPRHDRFR